MKKIWILTGLLCLFFTGCSAEKEKTIPEVGRIGNTLSVSREQAARTIALAFFTVEELENVQTKVSFSDLTEEDWAYPYICGAVEKGFFSGGEEGDFRPKDALTLWEAQNLMDRLAPEYDSRMVLTDENKNMAVSYELWIQLLEKALQARLGEDTLDSYGITEETGVLLSAENNLFDRGRFMAEGLELQPYMGSRIRFLEKEGQIVALLSVETAEPTIQNIYCKKENGQLLLDTGAGIVSFVYNGEVSEGIADVKLKEGKPSEIIPAEKFGTDTVKRIDGKEVYLEKQGALFWAENPRIYDGRGAELQKESYTNLICGTDIAEYYLKNGEVCGAVIRKDAVLEKVRVFLKGEAQKKVTVSAEGGFTLMHTKGEKSFPADAQAVLTADLPWFSHGILKITAESPIRLAFTDGTTYCYEGVLELEKRGDAFVIINELPLERYLLGVVPHEMPTGFGQRALEAQAITARSYVYHQFYGNTYCKEGAHVTDTTASQVYLGYAENETAEAAIHATAGMCAVTEDGKVAQTYFYSTSCGFGAGSEEVWSKDGSFSGKGKAYLQAQPHGEFSAPETEEDWLAFWQDWEKEGYDKDSPWYRWKVYFGCGQLTEILGKTLQAVSKTNSALVAVEKGSLADTGRLTDVHAERRGKGGVVMELKLEFEKAAVTVKTEYAVRKVLSPTRLMIGEPIYLQRKSGGTLTGNSILPSGFFAVKEMRNAEGMLTGVALYGGGNGHGVGMSQYGAKALAEQGKTAEEIIAHYFPGTTVERVVY